MGVLGALAMIAAGAYLLVEGGPEFGLIGWLLVGVGVVLLPVNFVLRRRGIRAGMRNPFGQ